MRSSKNLVWVYPIAGDPACRHVVVALVVSKARRATGHALATLSCACCLWWCRLYACMALAPVLPVSSLHPITGQPSPSRVRRHVPSKPTTPVPPSGAAATMAPTRRPTQPRLLPLLLLVALVLALSSLGPQGTQVQAAFIPSSTQAAAFVGRAGALSGSQTLRTTRPRGEVRAHYAEDTCLLSRLAFHFLHPLTHATI